MKRKEETTVLEVLESELDTKNINVEIKDKILLTLKEASVYSNIGINKIRELTNSDDCDFVLWVGNKRLIKREKFYEFLEHQFSI